MANFYGTVDGFFAYCTSLGYAVSSYSPSPSEVVEAALMRGSAYIDGKYRSRFPGKRTSGRSQPREWPRIDAIDASGETIADDETPVEIQYATYEAAFRELTTPGSLMPDYVATERVQSERVGDLSVTYANSTIMRASDSWPVIGVIDGILGPLLVSTTSPLFGETSGPYAS